MSHITSPSVPFQTFQTCSTQIYCKKVGEKSKYKKATTLKTDPKGPINHIYIRINPLKGGEKLSEYYIGEEWPDKVNRLRDWMGDSAEMNIVTALDETACEYRP